MEESADLNDPATWLDLAEWRLSAARSLIADGFFDDAVSRGYYAMFYAAKAALLTAGLTIKKHSSTVALFTQHFVRTGKVDAHFVSLLGRGQRARERSDYAPNIRIKKAEAEQVLRDAEEFVKKMRELVEATHP